MFKIWSVLYKDVFKIIPVIFRLVSLAVTLTAFR